MAKIPSFKRFVTEDFPEQKSWIGKLFQYLNQFMEAVVGAFDRSLTVTDNFDAQITQVVVDSLQEVSFKVNTRSRPQGLFVTNVELVSGTDISAAVWPIWQYNPKSNTIKISGWKGLDPTSKYKVTLYIHTS